jgi:hypothetical protein
MYAAALSHLLWKITLQLAFKSQKDTADTYTLKPFSVAEN